MKRKEFLKTTMTSLLAVGAFPVLKAYGLSTPADIIEQNKLEHISDEILTQFTALLDWMKKNGWNAYLKTATGLDIDKHYDEIDNELFRKLESLPSVREGLDDFAGVRAIEPGAPALSLLYHVLASPRIQPKDFRAVQYPSVEQLDILENYIYGLKEITISAAELKNEYIIALFAYEYRPAFKTPHHTHADLVFSRTGVARIGEKPMNYDSFNRCFTNEPKSQADKKKIAVTPARYGLFLAKVVQLNTKEIELLGRNAGEDHRNYFLLPIRKIFSNDLLINIKTVHFNEYHLSEKLHRLVMDDQFKLNLDVRDKFDVARPPFRVESKTSTSNTTIHSNLVRLTNKGSSVLVSSVENTLIRPAKQDGKYVRVEVPKDKNRYFTTYNTRGIVEEIELLTGKKIKTRSSNDYKKPRNTPLYLHIRYKTQDTDGKYEHLDRETEINANHWVGAFEDSICDGYVTVDMSGWTSSILPPELFKVCLPAFSIVTAPDFFQLVDNFDLLRFDVNTETYKGAESHFHEGGLLSLSAARMRPNPHTLSFPSMQEKNKQALLYTFTSVLSGVAKPDAGTDGEKFKEPEKRNYKSTSFIPDVCSFVFAPGWDVTYSNDTMINPDNDVKKSSFLSTRGLGSPFPEDMKLCAAMNGMWPVSSPDAARTFMGSLLKDFGNSTAIPLMDEEIGFHKGSPYNDASKPGEAQKETFGWDGEQGPFLEKYNNVFVVNFTDLGRADYVANAIDPARAGFDMSLLRDLKCDELIFRMECLRQCIKQIDDNNIVAYTKKWLVSAEKVDWRKGAEGYGIPLSMTGANDKSWAAMARPGINGNGYLYVFADTKYKNKDMNWVINDDTGKRRRQYCKAIDVCQVTDKAVSFCRLNSVGVISKKWKTVSIK